MNGRTNKRLRAVVAACAALLVTAANGDGAGTYGEDPYGLNTMTENQRIAAS